MLMLLSGRGSASAKIGRDVMSTGRTIKDRLTTGVGVYVGGDIIVAAIIDNPTITLAIVTSNLGRRTGSPSRATGWSSWRANRRCW